MRTSDEPWLTDAIEQLHAQTSRGPVEYADVDDVKEILDSVFKDAMTPEQQQQGGQGFNPLAMMMGGGGNRGGGRPAAVSRWGSADRHGRSRLVYRAHLR